MSRKLDEATNDYIESKLNKIKIKNKIPSHNKINKDTKEGLTLNKFAKFSELRLANWLAPEVVNPKMAAFSTSFSLFIFILYSFFQELQNSYFNFSEWIVVLIAAIIILICGIIILLLPGLNFAEEYEKYLDEKYNIKK